MSEMKQYLYICFCVFFFLLAACSEENNKFVSVGTLCLDVEQDGTLFTKSEVTSESIRVDIISEEGDTIKSYDNYLKDVKGQKLVIPVGTYFVFAHSTQSQEAAWEAPYYSGSLQVEIKSGEITTIQIVCKIANIKVAVEYDPELADHFINYETEVSNTSGKLLYTRDEYRAGYFQPEKLVANLKLVNTDGNEFTMQRVFTDIKEQTFYKLRYYISDSDGDEEQAGADVGVSINEKADTVYCNIFIKEESLVGKGVPKLSLSGFDENNMISYKKINEPIIPTGSLTINAANGFERLEVRAESSQLEQLGLSLFDLCNLDALDQLARGYLNTLKFPMPEITETTKEITLSFDQFAAYLDPASDVVAGVHNFTVYAMDKLHQEQEISFSYTVRPDVATITEDPFVWANFVLLKGNSAEVEGQAFMFKEGENEYVKIEPTIINNITGDYSVLIKVSPNTVCSYYAVSGLDETESKGQVKEFQMDIQGEVPNLNFDDWYKGDKSWYANKSKENFYWDSGNDGANTIGTNNPTSPEESIFVSGKAAKLQSTVISGVLASASLFTGKFNGTENTTHGKLLFGRPYTSRPTSLSGYYKYYPGQIDNREEYAPDSVKSGQNDWCHIYVALTTEQFEVRTALKQFFNKDASSVIAYGELTTNKQIEGSAVNGYQPFKIDIKYRKLNVTPKYIIIVASACKFGDYFTGSSKSLLYLDEFKLDFDYNKESFEGTVLDGYQIIDNE